MPRSKKKKSSQLGEEEIFLNVFYFREYLNISEVSILFVFVKEAKEKKKKKCFNIKKIQDVQILILYVLRMENCGKLVRGSCFST